VSQTLLYTCEAILITHRSPEIQDELDREIENVLSIPHEGPINTLSEDRLPEFEHGCQRLQSSINNVGSLVAVSKRLFSMKTDSPSVSRQTNQISKET
jgi:hypothetical protein